MKKQLIWVFEWRKSVHYWWSYILFSPECKELTGMLDPLLYRWSVPPVVIRCVHWTMQMEVLQTWIKAQGLAIVMVESMCLLFVSWQSDHFWQRYSQFHIWPWKFKVMVMAKVKPDGHIWGLEFSRCVCFLFHGNRTIFGWDIANSIFDLKIQDQGHNANRPKSYQVIYRSGPTIMPKIKEIQKSVQKLSREQKSAAGGGVRINRYKNIKSPLVYRGDLIIMILFITMQW